MIAMLAGVFSASILGSLHCAGMCGPMVTVAASPVQITSDGRSLAGTAGWRAVLLQTSLYNAARLLTYVSMGAIAGGIGKAIDLGASAAGVQKAACVICAAVLVGMGVMMIARQMGFAGFRGRAEPGRLARLLSRVHWRAMELTPAARAVAIGLATTLLPCGWLYAFVVTAAGTADVLGGALVMGAFWLGTVPVMTLVGAGVHRLLAPVRRHIPMGTALLLIGAGMASLLWRSGPMLSGAEAKADHCPLCELKSGGVP